MVLTKEKILEEVNQLPDTIDSDELLERFYLLSKIEKGLADVKQGNTFSMDEAKQKLGKWL